MNTNPLPGPLPSNGRGNAKVVSPRELLLPYQLKWVQDGARFKIVLASRQIGKSFMAAAEIVEDSLLRTKNEWIVLSAGERQALDFMGKVKEWSAAYSAALEDYQEERERPEALMKAAEIRWPNGSRCRVLPTNPATARGYSANLFLDEFALHEQPDEVWRAIYPSISNPLRGIWKIRIASTPKGKANKFADIWHEEGSRWSKHKITIHDAVAAGLAVDIDELRSGLNDPEGWAQEYECEFIDSTAVLLPYDLIKTCEHLEASEFIDPEFYRSSIPHRLFLGIDFGRRRDLTVCWVLEKVGDVLWTREVLTLDKTPTPDQVAILRGRIARAQVVCMDYQGPGVGMGDYLVKEFGEYRPDDHKFGKVELCDFTNSLKVDIYPKTRATFERLLVRIPDSRVIREDLHAVHRETTKTGMITYRAPHTADGHSDRCAALALALRAARTAGGAFAFQAVRPSSGGFARRVPIGRRKGVLV